MRTHRGYVIVPVDPPSLPDESLSVDVDVASEGHDSIRYSLCGGTMWLVITALYTFASWYGYTLTRGFYEGKLPEDADGRPAYGYRLSAAIMFGCMTTMCSAVTVGSCAASVWHYAKAGYRSGEKAFHYVGSFFYSCAPSPQHDLEAPAVRRQHNK